MHARAEKIRRLVSILGSVGVAGAILTTVTSASATTSRAAATTTAFALRATVAGGIKTVQGGQTLTFVFTETNQTAVSAREDIAITKVSNVSVVGNPPCVRPGGIAINSDTTTCEPGSVLPGQSASMVITTQVSGAVSGTAASVQVCLSNEGTGATGPCKTVSAKIA